jgi:hypothetical protein
MRDRLPTPELISEFLDQGKVSVSLNLLHEDAIYDLDVSDEQDSIVIALENTETNKFRMDISMLYLTGVDRGGYKYTAMFPFDAVYRLSLSIEGKDDVVRDYPLNTPKSYVIINEALDAYREHEDKVREILGINELLAKADELTQSARDILNNVISGIEEDFFKDRDNQ